ncbi:type I-C CRISPR-associated protein Cas7/Csd2 [Desulfocurvibacter africanus]|uniref:type I-C CRISPR-associated protein Cas7/Csd2 n=1 Tax=Desulfocurvibacter africanus TaxID=873 RepID=UPI00040D4469|nr:type I-C CRISPR-associated protein Cas7/Csd2 [Desulfocurvibacter africanus]
MSLSNKIDFAVVFRVANANPNGDPLNGNRPRINYDGKGEVSDVCLKRKMRDRLQEIGHAIFVQSDDRRIDSFKSLKARADSVIKDYSKPEQVIETACKTWFDVRAFGQIFSFAGKKKDAEKGSGVSIPVRGPVSIHPAFSLTPVSVTSTQITRSVSLEEEVKRGSDTMGMKHRVDHGVYLFYGAMNPQLAGRTGFSDEDAEVIKKVLPQLFDNDASSARPEGSMEVLKVYWWKHNSPSGQYSSAKVHGSLKVETLAHGDVEYSLTELAGLKPEVIAGS